MKTLTMEIGKPRLAGTVSTPGLNGTIPNRQINLSQDYNDLTNKPSINEVVLQGDLTLADLGIASAESLSLYVPKSSYMNVPGGNKRTVEISNVTGVLETFADNTLAGIRTRQNYNHFRVDSMVSVGGGEFGESGKYIDFAAGDIHTTSQINILDATNHANTIRVYAAPDNANSYIEFSAEGTGRQFISGLTEPLNDSEAANKKYVDDGLSAKQGTLTFDSAPTEDSTNPVTSGGVFAALENKQNTLTIDRYPEEDSENPVSSGGVWNELQDRQMKGDYAAAASGDTTHSAIRAVGIPFGVCDASSTSTAFTATVPGITSLYDGVSCYLMNGVVTSASGFTIDINGLGALPVYSTLSAASRATTLFNVNYTLLLVYNSRRVEGGCWDAYYGYDTNTNTIGYQVRTNSSSLPAAAKFYRYRLLFTSANGKKWVPANTSTSTNATAKRDVIQTPIDPHGEIVYYGTTTAIEADALVTAAQIWQQYTLTLGYSFNRTGAALVMPFPSPVYLKAAPQADGSAIIDADEPYVFSLPTTADGKIYIFLGRTYSAIAIELTMKHPVYHFYNGALRLWTGPV